MPPRLMASPLVCASTAPAWPVLEATHPATSASRLSWGEGGLSRGPGVSHKHCQDQGLMADGPCPGAPIWWGQEGQNPEVLPGPQVHLGPLPQGCSSPKGAHLRLGGAHITVSPAPTSPSGVLALVGRACWGLCSECRAWGGAGRRVGGSRAWGGAGPGRGSRAGAGSRAWGGEQGLGGTGRGG